MSETVTIDWWSSLSHSGLLIGPTALKTYFPEPASPPGFREAEALRRAISRFESGAEDGERALLSTLLEAVCGLEDGEGSRWLRGNQVPTEWTRRSLSGEAVKPRWLWEGPHGGRLPVFVDSGVGRLGVHRGRRSVSRVLEWLRATGEPLALLTNLRQWRLVYAGLDFHASAQADMEQWFEAGQPGPQLIALRTLLSPRTLAPERDGGAGTLLAAIRESRKGQAELSGVLGERVRQAVEQLIDAHGEPLGKMVEEGATSPREIYLAATRVVMRLVVVLFAEARDLLPRDNPIYHSSYSLEGLRETLSRVGGDSARSRLRQRFGAWPRILGLFRLVHEGSHHPELQIPRYGGELFAPGDRYGRDGVTRALAVFEEPEHGPDDAAVHHLLTLLARSHVKVRQGRQNVRVETAVDFSSLSSEYIGILYEGLLDFELRRSDPDDPMLFLTLGKEPVLPLSRLEAMDDKALKTLLESVKKDKDEGSDDEEAAEEEDTEAASGAPGEESEAPEEQPEAEEDDEAPDDAHQAARARAMAWARRAAEAARLVRRPRGRSAAADREYEERLERAARNLIRRVVVPGEWFLVRWGGTRKGAGTFYTRPQLAVPTVQRTLRPLACAPPEDAPQGYQVELLPAEQWRPRRPEEILALKVCDPAMGSGSFLVGALRYLTDVLYESLFHHGRIREEGDRTLVALLEGEGDEGSLTDERLPARPDDEHFEDRLRARLKRYVVERCLYGVDLDPLAVELARLSLWVETMDRDLPFEFLDHKLKVGNSLVGAWFDGFRDYPVMAWEREGGDKGHSTAVHHEKESWTKAIKEFRKRLKGELADCITGQQGVFEKVEGRDPATIHDEALAALERMHVFPPQNVEEKAAWYREHIEQNPAVRRLKEAMDAWCATWFWPADRLDCAPTPKTIQSLSDEGRGIVRTLAENYRFFHWELEFPDVFTGQGAGFDAVLGNPPWDIQKPNSKEYFSNLDPLYRGYGKQEALDRQRVLFNDNPDEERAWLLYSARFKALSNWCKHAANPFGDPQAGAKFSIANGSAGDELHRRWRERRLQRSCYADPHHPFRHQGGGDVNTYKLFLETSHALLRPAGRLGMIVPSGLYTDKGTTELRELFVTHCRWRWLFGFENRDGIFDIHRSFKFGPAIVEKDGETDAILTAFMHRNLDDWEQATRHIIPYPRAQIEQLSPLWKALFEVKSQPDIDVLTQIFASGEVFYQAQETVGLTFTTELHKTNDSKNLIPRSKIEALGIIQETDDVRDLGTRSQLAKAGYVAVWEGKTCRFESWPAQPESFARIRAIKKEYLSGVLPIGVRRIARSTDERTLIGCIVPPLTPTMYTIEVCRGASLNDALAVYGAISSFVLDFVIRFQVSSSVALGNIDSLPLPKDLPSAFSLLSYVTSRMFPGSRASVKSHIARRIATDAVVAEVYGVDECALQWILRDCDLPKSELAKQSVTQQLNPTGFWRVDKDKDPELRQTILTLVAYRDLRSLIQGYAGDREKAIEAFCNQNAGEGWMLPEALCLADLGLGHDERAKHPQPVRERMGPRFYDWQLEQSIEESWAECERHARNVLGDEQFERMMSGQGGHAGPNAKSGDIIGEPETEYSGAVQKPLF